MICGRCICRWGPEKKANVYNPREATLHYLLRFNGVKKKSNDKNKAINVNLKDDHGRTCLHFAATVGDLSMIEDLLSCHADPKAIENRGQRPLHYAAMHNKTPGVIELLAKKGSGVNQEDIHKNTALHLSAMFGNVQATLELLQTPIDITLVNGDGYTAMDLACLHGFAKIVDAFLCSHFEQVVPALDSDRNSPLHLASRNGHTDVCLLLLRNGISVNRVTVNGTALHEAVFHGRLEVTQILCEQGADVTIKNSDGFTPVQIAQRFSAAHSADKLLSILSNYKNQESMVGRALEDHISNEENELSVACGELVHILDKHSDGMWQVFTTKGQEQKSGLIPSRKLELLSALCNINNKTGFSGSNKTPSSTSSVSLASDVHSIPSNDRPHMVSINGASVNEQTARLLLDPQLVPQPAVAASDIAEWLGSLGIPQYTDNIRDNGYDIKELLVGITDADLNNIGIKDLTDKKSILKGVLPLSAVKYSLKSHPVNVSDWLYALGLSHLIPFFTSSGYEELTKVIDLTPHGLVKIGIRKPGDRKKLLRAIVGLKEWLTTNPKLLYREKPKKPARSISKNSNNDSPPVSAGLRPQEEPICNSFFEAYTRPIGGTGSRDSSCYDNISNCYEYNSDTTEQSPIITKLNNTNGRPDMIARIKPIRTMTPCSDGLSTIERQRRYTLELQHQQGSGVVPGSYDHHQLSPHNDAISCLDSSTSSDQIIKRGSSEHLDLISPCQDDNISGSDEPTYEQKEEPDFEVKEEPEFEEKGETDLMLDGSLHFHNIEKNTEKTKLVDKKSQNIAEREALMEDNICMSCKSKETEPPKVELKKHKKDFLEKLEKRMSNSHLLKNINWDSMEPKVAAVVKSVYDDDSNDISVDTSKSTPKNKPDNKVKKIPPPVAPKPKFLKKNSTVSKAETSKPEPTQSAKPTGTVFNDIENMFDEFSKELDTLLT